jgi:type II secretory pathway predicted ATPase ExeA
MYRAFYSLAGRPFTKEIKAADMFQSSSHQECHARLGYLRDNRGIGLVVGEPGSGKTTALRAFISALNPALYNPVYFPLSTVTVRDFYRGLALSLNLEPASRRIDVFHQIQDAVLSGYQGKKVTPFIVLDEMHLASTDFLSDLHLLFNYAMDSANPFVLVLCGLPQLGAKLSLVHHQPLSQRIITRYKMQPMGKEEVNAYIDHQMKLAGANYPIFSESALEAIATVSRGLPRLINNLATTALVYGCQRGLKQVNEEAVRLAAVEHGL